METVTGEQEKQPGQSGDQVVRWKNGRGISHPRVIEGSRDVMARHLPVFERNVLFVDMPLELSVRGADAFTAKVFRILKRDRSYRQQSLNSRLSNKSGLINCEPETTTL